MSEIDGLYMVRDFVQDDFNFVKASFLRGLYYGNDFYNLMPKSIFMNNYSIVADILIAKRQIKIACLKETPDVILGYAIGGPGLLDWVFVKKDWRGQGLMKALIPEIPNEYTHFSMQGLQMAKQYPTMKFNPFNL